MSGNCNKDNPVVSIRIPKIMLNEIDDICEINGLTRTELILTLVSRGIKKINERECNENGKNE